MTKKEGNKSWLDSGVEDILNIFSWLVGVSGAMISVILFNTADTYFGMIVLFSTLSAILTLRWLSRVIILLTDIRDNLSPGE